MLELRIEVVRVRGTCNAGLREGDTFILRGLDIVPQGAARTCRVALASVIMNAGRVAVESGPIYVSCPDPGTGEGGNVILGLSRTHEDHRD